MANAGTLEIQLLANMAKLQADMSQAKQSVGAAMESIERSVALASKALAGLVGGVLIGKLISVQREFDVLNSSLITVTGSSAKAAQEFAWIKQFAATTPYQLNEVTSAFVKMKALGLDSSEAALRSYGNTASAMGKGLNQMIEAVADAGTGEFERLKEFGIKASKQGEQVSFTFQGVTTKIKNNAEEISGYLRTIGNDKFGDAMALRAATLDGAISNLADKWNELFLTINQNQTGTAIAEGVKQATNALDLLIVSVDSIAEAIVTGAKIAAAYIALFVAAPAVFAAASAAFTVLVNAVAVYAYGVLFEGTAATAAFNTALFGTSVSAGLATGALTATRLAASLLFAAFAGWQIGTYLREQFAEVRVAGLWMVGGLLEAWESMQYGFDTAINGMKSLFYGFVAGLGSTLQNIPGFAMAGKILSDIGDKNLKRIASDQAAAKTAYEGNVAAIQQNILEMAAWEMANDKASKAVGTHTQAVSAAKEATKASKDGAKERLDATLAQYERELEAVKEIEDSKLRAMETAHTRGLISERDYITQKSQLEQEANIDRQAAVELELEAVERSGIAKDARLAQEKGLSKELEKLSADYLVIKEKEADALTILDEKEYKQGLEANAKMLESQQDLTTSLQAQLKDRQRANAEIGLSAKAIDELRSKTMELNAAELERRAGVHADPKIAAEYRAQAAALRGLIAANAEGIAKSSAIAEFAATWQSVDKTAHDVFVNIFDGGQDAFTKLGNVLKSTLLDLLYQMTVRKWVFDITASVTGQTGATLAGNVVSGVTSSANSMGTFGSLGSFGATVANAGSTISMFGTQVLASAQNMIGMTGTFAQLATATTQASGSVAGLSSGMAAAAKATPYVLAAIAAAKTIESLTSIKISPAGTFLYGGSGYDTESGFKWGGRRDYMQEGGYRGSNKNSEWFDPDKAVSDYLTATGEAITTSVKDWAKTIGLSADAVDSYSQQVEIALDGLDAKGVTAAIDKTMAGFGESLTQATYGLSADTLKTLATNLQGVNAVFEAVGMSALDASMGSAELATSIITAAGSLDNLGKLTSAAYEALTTPTQKAANSATQLDKAFELLGVSTPKTVKDLTKLAQAQDLTSDAGRKAAVGILSLLPALQQVQDATKATREAMLKDAGINQGDIASVVKKGLIDGTLKNAGGEISDVVMSGIQNALYGKMADAITNSFTDEMLAPLLDAMQKGKSLPEALAAVDWTQVKSKFQQTVDDISAIFDNTQVSQGIGALKGAIQDIFSTASYNIPKGWILTKDEATKAATGGLITGPGTGTSDSIPAMLSNGEFVVKASSAAKLGTGFLNAINSGAMPANRATGGYVWDPQVGSRVIDADLGYTTAYDDVRRAVPGMAQMMDVDIAAWQGGQTGYSNVSPGGTASGGASTAKDLTSAYESLSNDSAQTYIDVLRAMGEVYTANTLALAKATEGFDALHVAMYREIEAGKQLVTMRETLSQAQKDYATSEVELLKAQGNTAGAAAKQREIDLIDVTTQKATANARLLEDGLSENEKSYQTAIVATADLTVAQYDLTKAREAEISAAGRLLSATQSVASARIGLLEATGNKGTAASDQRAIDLKDTFDSLSAASSRLAKGGLSEAEKAIALNTVTTDLQTVAQYDLGKAIEKTTGYVSAAISGLENLQTTFAGINVSALTALGDKTGAGAAQKAIDLTPINDAATAAQAMLDSGTVTDTAVIAGLKLTVTTAKLADAQYDLNKAVTAGVAGLTSVKSALEGFQKTGETLDVQKARLLGDDAGADALQKGIDLKDVYTSMADATATLATDGITTLQRSIAEATIIAGSAAEAQYVKNKLLTDEIEILGRYKSAKEDADSTNLELMKAMGNTAGAAALELANATKGFTDAQIATVRQTNATKGLIAAYGNLSSTADMVTNSRIGLLTANGDTAGAAALQRELDIKPYITAIADANTQLSIATTQAEKDILNQTIATNTQAIANVDLSKSLDKESQAANDAKTAADALASSYADLKKQIESANIELLRASGDTAAADEAAMALALRDHAGDAYYESLYRELLTIQKLTDARQQLNGMEDSAVQNQIKLIRANGGNIQANALERSAFLKNATAPAAAAQAELDQANVSWSKFLSTKGVALSGPSASNINTALAGSPDADIRRQVLAGTKDGIGYSPYAADQSVQALLQEFTSMGRTASQQANLQSVVDTAKGMAAAYDLNKSLEGQLKIIELQDEAYKHNLDAQKNLADAQKAYADVLKSTISTMRDFIATLDGGASPLQNLSTARDNFQAVASKAASGDTSAYKDLTPAAKTFLDLSKNYSKSIQDYQRDEARVRATLNAVIRVNQNELDKLPQDIAKAADPTKDAWLKLQEATAKEADTSIMLTALSVDKAASTRRLRTAEETLADRYLESVLLLEEANKQPLLKVFNDALKTKVDDSTLPEYTAFNLGTIWGTQIAHVLPQTPLTNADMNNIIADHFPGLEPSDFLTALTSAQLTALVNGVLPERLTAANLVSTTADVSNIVSTQIGQILPANFAGSAFDAQQMMQTAINQMMSAITPARPTSPDLSTTHHNTVQDQGLGGGSSGIGTTNWLALSASEVASRLGVRTENINNAEYLSAILATYTSPSEYNPQNDQYIASLRDYGKAKGFPGFAVGTNNVPHDMLAKIHKDEAIIPAPFNPERYAKASGNTVLVEKIQALTAEVGRLTQKLEAGQNEIAANTRKTAQVLDKFDIDGLPKARK